MRSKRRLESLDVEALEPVVGGSGKGYAVCEWLGMSPRGHCTTEAIMDGMRRSRRQKRPARLPAPPDGQA